MFNKQTQDYYKQTQDYYKQTQDYYKQIQDYYKQTQDYYKQTQDYYKQTQDYYKQTQDYYKQTQDYYNWNFTFVEETGWKQLQRDMWVKSFLNFLCKICNKNNLEERITFWGRASSLTSWMNKSKHE